MHFKQPSHNSNNQPPLLTDDSHLSRQWIIQSLKDIHKKSAMLEKCWEYFCSQHMKSYFYTTDQKNMSKSSLTISKVM